MGSSPEPSSGSVAGKIQERIQTNSNPNWKLDFASAGGWAMVETSRTSFVSAVVEQGGDSEALAESMIAESDMAVAEVGAEA